MRDVVVRLKDGTVLCGPLWDWRPREGYFTIVSEVNYGPILLSDCVSAINEQQWVRHDLIEDVDLLARAKAEGWVPCSS